MDKDSLPNVLGEMKRKSMLFEDFTDEDDFEPLVFKRNVRASPAKRKSMLFEDFSDEDDFEPLVFRRNVCASPAKRKSMLFEDFSDDDDFEPLVFKRNVCASPAKRKSMLFEDFTDEDDFEPLVFKRNVCASPAKRKSMLFEDFTDEDDFEPLIFRRNVRASPAAKPIACSAFSSAASSGTASKAAATGFVSGRKRKFVVQVHPSKLKYKIGMETEETTAKQAQRQMHQFTSTVMELCSGFETSKKKNEELGKEVTDLEDQIQKWKDQKASWDETKKELEMERDEARKEALFAVCEKCAIEEKLEKAAKQVDDAKNSAKKAIYEAVASTTRCYKNFFGNLVASLENCEGESLKDGAKELIKEILCDDRALADEATHVAGHSGDDTIKDKAP